MITRDSKNILVADDSNFFRAKLSDIIMEAGHKIRYARNGREVIKEISSGFKIDLIILDLQMPEVDGFGVLQWINDNGMRGRHKILAITGAYEEAQVIGRLKALGISGFMSKDFPPERVIFRINTILFAEKIADGVQRKRLAVSVPVDFARGSEVCTGVIINLSESGAFIQTSNYRFPDGTAIGLKFSIPGSAGLVNARGTVRWFPEEFGPNALFSGCGVIFTDISEADQSRIHEYIESEYARLAEISLTNKR